MGDLLSLHKDRIVVEDDAFHHPEFKNLFSLDPSKEKVNFHNQIRYIYYVYSKKSSYYELLPDERKLIVVNDHFKEKGYTVKTFEESPGVKEAIDKYNSLQLTSKEKALESCKKKIQEYIEFWELTTITKDTHKTVVESLEGVETLLKLQERIEKQVLGQQSSKIVGGGKASLFEN